MKAIFAVAITCFALYGCNGKAADPPATTGVTTTATGSPGKDAQSGSGGGIAPIGPNVGAMTPVSGGEDLGSGTGGGVGQMAKSQAKKAADQSTAPAATGDNEGN